MDDDRSIMTRLSPTKGAVPVVVPIPPIPARSGPSLHPHFPADPEATLKGARAASQSLKAFCGRNLGVCGHCHTIPKGSVPPIRKARLRANGSGTPAANGMTFLD